MLTEISGTIVKGAIRVDGPMELPDDCRVRITVEPCDESLRPADNATWKAFLSRCREAPVSAGRRYWNREELYDRR